MRKLKLITGKHSSAVIARMSDENKKSEYTMFITNDIDTVRNYVELMQRDSLLIGSTSITEESLTRNRIFGFECTDTGDKITVTPTLRPPELKKSRLATLDNLEKSGLCIMFKVLGHTAVMRFDDEEAQDEIFEKLI